MLKYALLITGISMLIVLGCKKKHDNATDVPQVRTADITNITATTARSGGTITSDGGTAITVSGICWSRTDHDPTIADDTTRSTTSTGSFIADMHNLQPNVTYYVRAYAINSAGIGYGDRESFTTTTGNAAPIAIGITIAGTISAGEKIVARYTYFDLENNPENGTAFQWYIANDTTGATVTPVSHATDSSYIIQATDENKFLRVGITPKASAGTSPGQEFRSKWIGPISTQPASVTFTYNGQMVTYGIITSSVTGRKWLDRNLGAPNTPTAFDDWRNMGDLFQWGRKADGHQLINRGATQATTTAVNGTTVTRSTSDNPGHSLFITPVNDPIDWRLTSNPNLWLVSGGVNNVCPAGWHVASGAEWQAENIISVQDAFTRLKITATGLRWAADGSVTVSNVAGQYWTSATVTPVLSINFIVAASGISANFEPHATGLGVRCIKD